MPENQNVLRSSEQYTVYYKFLTAYVDFETRNSILNFYNIRKLYEEKKREILTDSGTLGVRIIK